ncbi:adenylate/guanylate cyclase domain-containing protein [Sinimarinibacterium flocculans]|uniref:Class 3 adenylate cyclase n=1 Tax=Sinimarinibacterium flocculans TaxID=985250 RepID=A0A318EEH2_9GAMM|nr:adenylate/guanylate cyclase domain-containing protein [Sinimarinibacterium flocculans]PXV68589.1 class 3 adenylate cyclase [Sinimarinibacterium flocculans]
MNNGYEVVAIIALGMGLVFWVTDRASPTSRTLAFFLGLLGVSVFGNAQVVDHWLETPLPAWVRLIGLLDAAVFIAGCQWGLRVSQTVSDVPDEDRQDRLIRIAQALSLLYALMVAAAPELRYHELALALREQRLPSPAFALFVMPALAAGALVLFAGVLLLRRRPDQAEQVRIFAALAAMPVLTVALVLPARIAPLALAVGEVIFLYGALRYYMILGARGMFMSQFLSPQVAALVRERGLRHAMARKRVDVTVVCCDIRRFTAYAQAHSPEQVMRLLRAYYAAVAAAAQDFGGTVKDMAGDGALILIGAPVPYPDRSARAIGLARRLQARVRPVLKRYSPDLGLGVGVAGGSVAVGIVGEGGRYEYMAVGPAVNLASRLCDKALDGEIHIDETTLQASGESLPARRRRRYVRGIGVLVTTYVLESGD